MSTAQRQRAAGKAEARRRTAAGVLAEQRTAERRRRTRTAALAGALVVALLVVLGIAVQASRTAEQQQGADPTGVTAEGAFVVGDAAAPVTVAVYADFLCPACKWFEQSSGAALDRYVDAGTVKVEYHPIAILDRASTTRYSTRAAAASAAAAEQGRFREYAAALYERQPAEGGAGLSDDELVEIGRSVGIESAAFADAVHEGRYAGWVTRATDLASRAGVTGTPTVLVDGERLPVPDAASLRAAVEAAAG